MKRIAALFLLALVVFSFTCCQSGYALENPDSPDRVKIFDTPSETAPIQPDFEKEQSPEENTDTFEQQNKEEKTESNPIQGKPSTSNSKTTTAKPTNNGTVYITPTGKRYHLSSTCGGKNSTPTTLEEALGLGLTPCGKCAK